LVCHQFYASQMSRTYELSQKSLRIAPAAGSDITGEVRWSRVTFVSVVVGLPVIGLAIWLGSPRPTLGGVPGDVMVILGAVAMITVMISALTRVSDFGPAWIENLTPLQLAGILISGLILTVVGWSDIYEHAALAHPSGVSACFALTTNAHDHLREPHVGHWGSLYYTMGMLTTAGTGVLGAASSTCQALTTIQLIENLLLVVTSVSLASAWISRAMGARREQRRQAQGHGPSQTHPH
jgi:hypothetical protein